jgi:hypothetical protein
MPLDRVPANRRQRLSGSGDAVRTQRFLPAMRAISAATRLSTN